MVKISLVKPSHAKDIWSIVWPILEKAVNQGYGIDDSANVLEDIEQEYRFLILATVEGKIKGAAVIVFREGSEKFADIQYVAGEDMKEWSKDMNKAINALAKAEGCKIITAFGRKAWSRIWRDFTQTDKFLFVKEVA